MKLKGEGGEINGRGNTVGQHFIHAFWRLLFCFFSKRVWGEDTLKFPATGNSNHKKIVILGESMESVSMKRGNFPYLNGNTIVKWLVLYRIAFWSPFFNSFINCRVIAERRNRAKSLQKKITIF